MIIQEGEDDKAVERKGLHNVIWAKLDTCIGRTEGYRDLIQRFIDDSPIEVLREIARNEEEDGDAEEE